MADDDFFDTPPQSSGTYTSSSSLLGGAAPGSSSSESQSTSTPSSITSAQTDWGLMQSQLLSALGDRTYNWAMDQYGKGQGVTDQTIANFLEMSGKGKGLADTLLHQYQDQIKPLIDNYIREAGTYASEGRQRFEAGKAMSTVSQADTAAMNELERKLEGTGVNVNSGRIQEQMIASRVADAAARAGAGTAAAQRTQDIGRAMTEKGIAMGQKMPEQAIGAIQSSYAGLTGAENAILGLLNTGKNLADAAAPYHQAAVAANKVPPVGQTAQSTTKQQSQQAVPQGGGGGGGSKGGGGQKQPAEKSKQPAGGGRQPGEGGGKGGGAGGGGDGGTGQKGVRDTGAYGATYRNPLQTGKKDDESTGAPDPLEGYQGPIGYVDDTGTVYPEMSPGAGTTTWDDALANPAPPAWTLPEVGSRGFNVDPASAGGDNPQLGIPPGQGPLGGFPNTSWDDAFANAAPMRGQSPSGGGQDFSDYNAQNEFGGSYGEEPYTPWGGQDFSGYDASNDFSGADYGGGYNEDTGDTNYDVSSYDASNDFSGADYGGGYDEDTGDTNYDASSYDASNDFSGADYGGGYDEDTGDTNYDASSYDASNDFSGADYGGGYDNSGYDASNDYSEADYGGGYGEEEYARGGRVRRPPARGVMPTTGGAVSRSMSPSRGRQTDDISARLNAGEYVIPRDVVAHQGTKFFTDLIAKSRKLRTGMTGARPKPTMRSALPQGRPAFQSRALPPR